MFFNFKSSLPIISPCILLTLIGCTTTGSSNKATQSYTQKTGENVKFESTPDGGLVTLWDPHDITYEKSCITPCELELDTRRTLNMKAELSGYLTKNNPNMFYKDPALEKLTKTLISATTGGKSYNYGQRTVKIPFYTIEEKARIDAEKEAAAQQKIAETEARNRKLKQFLSDDILNPCTPVPGETSVNIQPLIRRPGRMPPNANKSGHCKIKLNVGLSGEITDAITTFCTDEVFKSTSLEAVSNWLYNPRLKNNTVYEQCGVETIIRYVLTDSQGNIIPE